MLATAAPPTPPAEPSLLDAVLDVALTGIVLLRPCHAPDTNELVDFDLAYLNPEGHRLLQRPGHPANSLLALWPRLHESGGFAFCRDTFLADTAGTFDLNQPAESAENSYRLAARRHGEQLLVSFVAVDRTHRALEAALLASQASHRNARTEAEQQRTLLQAVLAQAPVGIGLFQGEDLVVTVANEQICAMWGYAPEEVLGLPLLQGIPELRGQGFEEILAEVARTRIPFIGTEVPAKLLRNGQLETHYFNFVYQHMYGPDGSVVGVVDVALDVTEQVLARQHAQELNEELAAEVAVRAQATLVAQAQAELHRRRLERLFMAAPAAIAILSGPALVYELANPIYQEQFPGRALLGLPLLQALPEPAASEMYAHMRRVYVTGEPYHHSHTNTGQGGQGAVVARSFNSMYKARRNQDGVVDGLLVFSFEITEQVLAQQRVEVLQAKALAAAQRHARERETYYQVFEQTPARIALVRGPKHRFAYCNEAYQQLFPDRQLRGNGLAVALPEASAQGFVALLDHVYQTGETYFGSEVPFTAQQAGAAPSTIYFDFTYQAYREEGAIVGVSIFAYDVTGQVQARRQREAQQRQLQELFEQAPVSICLFGGPEFVYELASLRHQELFPHRQLLGLPLLQAVPELAGQPVWDALQRVFETGETVVDLGVLVPLVRYEGASPQDTYFDYIFQARRSPDGNIDGVLVFAFEITELVRGRQQVQVLNHELQATNQLLTSANADLSNFVYTASHDLKTPIANIEGLLNMLHQQLPAEVQAQGLVPSVLGLMRKAVDRFQLTINQLADITWQQQVYAPAAETIDLAALVESVRQDLAPLLASTQAEIAVDVAASPRVSFSAKNLRSIVYNLLSNAVKYHAPGRPPRVQLRARRSATAATTVLEVQDNGLGLSATQQGKLFGLFRRLHDHVEGSGVGLYMVKKMVDNAGGTIAVDSEPGVGSTFTVHLPD